MDFFDGLDPTRYGNFKVHIFNSLDAGTLQPAEDLSVVYGWVSNWRKVHGIKEKLGNGSSFATIQQDNGKTPTKNSGGEGEGGKKKNVKCNQFGHYANKYKKGQESSIADGEQIRTLHATWSEACAYHTNII